MKRKKVLWIIALAGWLLAGTGASAGLFFYYGLPPGTCIAVGANAGFVCVLAGLIGLSVWKGMGKPAESQVIQKKQENN